jgi:hypothetical protein
VLAAQVITELLRRPAPANQSLFGVSVYGHNPTAYRAVVPKELILRPSNTLQNSTDGPFCGAQDIHITGICGIAPIPETVLEVCE